MRSAATSGTRSEAVRGAALAVTAMLCFQTGTALSVPLLTSVGPTTATWIRLLGAATMALILARPSFARRPLAAYVPAVGLGLAMCGMSVFFAEAVTRMNLGTATAIEFLGPLGLAIATSRCWPDAGWGLLAASGVMLLTETLSGHGGEGGGGLAYALSAACCWAAYIIMAQRVAQVFSGMEGLAISLVVAVIVATPFGMAELKADTSWMAVAMLCGLGILIPGLPYSLEMMALRRMNARAFGVLMSLDPALATLVGMVLLHQLPGWIAALGIACVVIASIGTMIGKSAGSHATPS